MQAQIVDILSEAVKVEAAISLPPILHVLSCLARDLQQDFLPYLPRVLTTATNLVKSGAHLSTTLTSSASGLHIQGQCNCCQQKQCDIPQVAADAFITCQPHSNPVD